MGYGRRMAWEPVAVLRERMSRERGRLERTSPRTLALAYPSPYSAGMSSLGFQQIYKLIQNSEDLACERFFLPDSAQGFDVAPLSYERERPLSELPLIAFSVAYELELAGLITMLESSRIPSLRSERDERHPLIVGGGPLTFSNPLPLAAYADVIVMGEAEEIVLPLLRELMAEGDREVALRLAAERAHVFVPSIHGDAMPPVARCEDSLLPAYSAIQTPDTELFDMFLIETERGCSRSCAYCVMRRSTNGGMRLVKQERILELVPEGTRRVGLVGAAVSDHPRVVEIVDTLAERGCEVGLSSLRPDRLTDPFVAALKKAGTRALTTAMDGPSERLRESLERRARVKHLERAAELARTHGMKRLKLYLMIGLPGETEEDIAECVAFVATLSKRIPIALGIAPFCAKRNTPLDGAPFAGIDVVGRRLDLLKRGLRGRADVRSTSARWAWVEYVLAQGGVEEGKAVRNAVADGGTFADYRRAFQAIAKTKPRRSLAIAPL